MSLVNSQKFRFTWRIKNALYCFHPITSPEFTLKITEESWMDWCLELFPHVDNSVICCSLKLKNQTVEKVSATFCFKVVGANGRVLKEVTGEKAFFHYTDWDYKVLLSRAELASDTSTWLPNGALIIQCEIVAKCQIPKIRNNFSISEYDFLKAEKDTSNENKYLYEEQLNEEAVTQRKFSGECVACTNIGIDILNHTFRGRLNDDYYSYRNLVRNTECAALLCFQLKLNVKENKVLIKIKRTVGLKTEFCTCKIVIYGSSGIDLHSGKYQHIFEGTKPWFISFEPTSFDSFLKPITMKSKFKITNFGDDSEIEHLSDTCFLVSENLYPDSESPFYIGLSMYNQQTNCDLTLISKDGKELKAHKAVLQAKAAIFYEILEQRNRVEMQNNRVKLLDIDFETLNLLLRYIYSSYPEDVGEDAAKKLYLLALKYKMWPLVTHCFSLIVSKLTVSNVFDVMKFADLNHNLPLKTLVNGFVVENSVLVFQSCQWKLLQEKNPKFASAVIKWFSVEYGKKLDKYRCCLRNFDFHS